MIVTRLDMVALGTSCRAACPVMQERFAPAACAGSDEGAALVPVRREPRCTIARWPRHDASSSRSSPVRRVRESPGR